MCGRYLIILSPEEMRRLYGYDEVPNFPARYNVAPTQPIPVVRLNNGRREFALVRWGLLPPWVKDPAKFTLLINARSETISEKPAFRNAVRRRRCLLPMDGFYEWKREGERKTPYVVRPRDGVRMAFAGLWETWMGPNGEELETAAIVTTSANRTLAPIHDRMPVMLTPDAFEPWLDCVNVDEREASALMRPARDDLLEVYPVSSAVNRVANDSPDLLKHMSPDEIEQTVAAKPPAPKRKPAAVPDDQQFSLF